MKATRTFLLAAGFSSGMAAALLLLALVLGWETLSLRARLGEAQTQVQAARAELEHWRSQQQLAESRQAEHQRRLETLQAELAALRGNRPTNPPAAPAARVHVFSQGRYLGTGRLATGERGAEQELTVHLDGPGAGTANRGPSATAAAVTAFSIAHHYPSWPWLWTLGWVVGEPTNNAAPSPGNNAGPAHPVPPQVAPTPPPAPAVVARSAWPGGLRTLKITGLKTVPRPGQPLLGNQRLFPAAVPSGSIPRQVPELGATVPSGRGLAKRPGVPR